MLRQRVLSAIVLIPILFICIWFGDPWFSIGISIASILAIVEFHAMIGLSRTHPLTIFGIVWVLLFVINAYYTPSYESRSAWFLVPMALAVSAFMLPLIGITILRRPREKVLADSLWSLSGILYLGLLLGHWILLNNSEDWDGKDWVLLALFSNIAVDTSAFFVGRAWGKHKLAPAISPGKTWEGAVGGLVGVIAASVLLALILGIDVPLWKIVFIGCMIGIFAQLGDLAESKLKRVKGVKDAGNLIPGHGGILDRLDSIVFTGVVVYYCLRWLIL